MRWALVLLAVLGARPAAAVSLVVEATGARPFTAISLMGEFELWKDRTFLTACFGSTRSAPLQISSGGAGSEELTVDLPRSNQLCLGLDHGLNDHWRVSAMASLAPRVSSKIQVLDRPTLVFRSENGSTGASVGVSYDTASLDEVQWGVDLGLSGNAYSLSHSWSTVWRTRRFPTTLLTLRPSAGVVVAFGSTQLMLRGSYTAYSQDPLRAGAVSAAELLVVDAVVQRSVDASQYYGLNVEYGAFLQQTANRLMAADALSGLSTAPIWFELRPAVQHRFTRWLRGQVGYAYDKYVEGAGQAHVASTKWTVTFSENVQTWVAASAQLDMPGTVPPQVYGILTLGVEVSF